MTIFEAKILPIKPRTTSLEANLEDHLSKAVVCALYQHLRAVSKNVIAVLFRTATPGTRNIH
ncbi:hypothetical protein F383_07361 [Gossypium arboreum]|uniref:Uncharacterized protein n=1 Tax=Gossypium arboreum TaxID=29729 RepID=A0A0B0P1M2_GOSAR|nr:hypothetical protein F383_07361 [Gossypium arboreum]